MCSFTVFVLPLVDLLVSGALVSSSSRNERGTQEGKERIRERSKDNFKLHSAPGQSSCVPPGKNHGAKTAAVLYILFVRLSLHSRPHDVHFVHCKTTEKDGGHVWVFV